MSDLIRKVEALERICDHYTPLTESCKADLIEYSEILRFDRNTCLVKAGTFYEHTFFITTGAARAYYLKDGKEISDWFALEDDFVCALNCFFQQAPSSHFIEFTEATTVLEIKQMHYLLLVDKHHDFERLARIVVTKTMLQLQQRIVAAQFQTAGQKYDNLLKARPDIIRRMPLGHIASYLGITLETLSRIRHPKNGI